jgi:hypothetical protein
MAALFINTKESTIQLLNLKQIKAESENTEKKHSP